MRRIAPELQEAVESELKKLQVAGIIRKAQYPQWISNMVIVPKMNGGVRICIDFSDLNNVFPKDSFPLPGIDQLVESIVGYKAITLMDGYSGYNQIPLAPEDQEHTSFFRPRGLYCYTKIPFGLRNAGATYQRLVEDMFEDKIHNTIEVYMDNMLVKSKVTANHIDDLREIFQTMRKYKMRVNSAKCTFWVTSSKFLGYIITDKGIESDPKNIRVVLEMSSPVTIKDVQWLNGNLAVLGRFNSRSPDKLLKTPEPDEVLTLYLGATSSAISAVLVKNVGAEEKHVYFISKTMNPAEKNYTRIEQLILSLVFATQKLRTYFQTHRIRVLTKSSIESLLDNAARSGRISKWSAQIKQFDIFYEMRTAVKAQAVADFLADFSLDDEDEIEDIPGMEEDREDPSDLLETCSPTRWEVFVDGSSNKDGSGLGLVFTTPKGKKMFHSFRLEFKATNNVTEYKAVIHALRIIVEMGIHDVRLTSDSQLVIRQINGKYAIHDPVLQKYWELAQFYIGQIPNIKFRHICRKDNRHSDALAYIASMLTDSSIEGIRVMRILMPSVPEPVDTKAYIEVTTADKYKDGDWQKPIHQYLEMGEFPKGRPEINKIKSKAAAHELRDGVLYRKSYLGPLLRCLRKEDGNSILNELHYGVADNHSSARSLATRAKTMGYFWPYMNEDTKHMALICDECQKFGKKIHAPAVTLINPWPFAKWGINVGPLHVGSGQRKYLIVATDYFTKWVEDAPLRHIRDKDIFRFIWEHIICRFGVPAAIVSDNGKLLQGKNIDLFFNTYNIRKVRQ
ncbi:uncharacterized protein LOC113279117 [Papaver somniferum]|uniref:uncharacterized protein LOC113279117 n=1 Tax=Papaver somniferum TaxID=3469 RepID=UPI000E6F6BC5|nr:uncharacterized protein LOC113279117 [Papaver somniferum]